MSKLRQLIRESINEYIKAIDEAGHKAGMEARMTATQDAIAKRKKMTELDGLDEDVKGMIDPKKVKDINAEVKALEKSLTKLQKQLDKFTSKSDNGEKIEDTEDTEEKEIVDENVEDSPYNPKNKDNVNRFSLGMEDNTEDDEERYDADGNQTDDGSYNADGNLVDLEREIGRAEYNRVDESFLHMQKLAGLITEAQYQAKKKIKR